VEVEPLDLPKGLADELFGRLSLFYIGGERNASEILKNQNKSTEKRDTDQSAIRSLAIQLKNDLQSGNIDSVGELLDKNWRLKRGLTAGISSDKIDEIYEKGLANGACGGKLLGAGGAGFMLFYSSKKDKPALRAALKGCREMPFKMETDGSAVVFNDHH